MDLKTRNYGVIEETEDPHQHASADEPIDAESPDAASRRLRITYAHLRQHGFTPVNASCIGKVCTHEPNI